MLCYHWWGGCVLVVAHVLFYTTSFGTHAVLSLVGTLCSDGSPCCFFKQPLLVLMLCSHWWGGCVLVVANFDY